MPENDNIQPYEAEDLASQLRERKADDKKKKEGEDDKSEANSEEAGKGGLRERVAKARQALNIKERAKKKIEEKVTAPMKRGTGMMLRWAWLNLIPSWGLTIIYLNTHVFLRLVFPKVFCKLGDEWVPKIVAKHNPKNIAGTAFGIVEVIGLVMLDATIFFVIISVLAFIVWLANNIFLQAGIWVLDHI